MAAKKNLPVSKTQYNKLVKQCLQLISDYKILFVTDLIALLPFSKSTFYVYGLDKSDAVKEAIENNKTMIKQKLRAKWYESSTPTLQIALYKILATPEERKAMSSSTKEAKSAVIASATLFLLSFTSKEYSTLSFGDGICGVSSSDTVFWAFLVCEDFR